MVTDTHVGPRLQGTASSLKHTQKIIKLLTIILKGLIFMDVLSI